jgi:hypothetical protein
MKGRVLQRTVPSVGLANVPSQTQPLFGTYHSNARLSLQSRALIVCESATMTAKRERCADIVLGNRKSVCLPPR